MCCIEGFVLSPQILLSSNQTMFVPLPAQQEPTRSCFFYYTSCLFLYLFSKIAIVPGLRCLVCNCKCKQDMLSFYHTQEEINQQGEKICKFLAIHARLSKLVCLLDYISNIIFSFCTAVLTQVPVKSQTSKILKKNRACYWKCNIFFLFPDAGCSCR